MNPSAVAVNVCCDDCWWQREAVGPVLPENDEAEHKANE